MRSALIFVVLFLAAGIGVHGSKYVPAGGGSNAFASPGSPTVRERILERVADPGAAFLLLIAGVSGIIVEFLAPGLVVPGVAGGVAACVAVASLAQHPIRLTGIALLLLAAMLLGLTIRGSRPILLGIAVAIAMAAGAGNLIDGPPGSGIGWKTAIGATVPFSFAATALLTLAGIAKRNKTAIGESTAVRSAIKVRASRLRVDKA